MASYQDRRKWLLIGSVSVLILVLLISLLFLIFGGEKLPDNAVVIEDGLLKGETLNDEELKKLNALLTKEPVLSKLPLTVEYFSDDFSDYVKYILSYEMDDSAESERGFYLIMKDYTGEGIDVGVAKLNEMGMETEGLRLDYIDLTSEMEQGHAE